MTAHQASVIIGLLEGMFIMLAAGLIAGCGMLSYLCGKAGRRRYGGGCSACCVTLASCLLSR